MPAAVALGQVMTKRVIPHIIVPYLLSQEDDNADSQDTQQPKEEAIKTLLMVHNVAENEKSKMLFGMIKGLKNVFAVRLIVFLCLLRTSGFDSDFIDANIVTGYFRI